jgi:hypothetical protein
MWELNMAKTERVVVMMTTEQKEKISRLAAAEGVSLGAYLRQQALGNEVLLSALLDDLAASTAKTSASLDRTLARLDESGRSRPAIEEAARARAVAEFSVLDPELFAQIVRKHVTGGCA